MSRESLGPARPASAGVDYNTKEDGMRQYLIALFYKNGETRFFSPTAVTPLEALKKVKENASLRMRDVDSFKIETVGLVV